MGVMFYLSCNYKDLFLLRNVKMIFFTKRNTADDATDGAGVDRRFYVGLMWLDIILLMKIGPV